MSLRGTSIEAHPNFPWLDPADVSGIAGLLATIGWLEDGESVVEVGKAGEGNMNLTLRVRTERRSVILKQARPWVEKYDHIAAPWDRILYEQGFYQRVQDIPEVAPQMPRVYTSDAGARVLLLEDLDDAADYMGIYDGAELGVEDLRSMARYARALHDNTRGVPDSEFENRAMRELNHAHIFVIPLQPENGIELESFEPGLQAAADSLKADDGYCVHVEGAGVRYLANGPCLLHGDFFPGSWLSTAAGVRVIDPEFCFYGDPEFDLGVVVAHCALAGSTFDSARSFLDAYDSPFDEALVAEYAATEVMRRLIGVAQLPIPPTVKFRVPLLRRARAALMSATIEALWS